MTYKKQILALISEWQNSKYKSADQLESAHFAALAGWAGVAIAGLKSLEQGDRATLKSEQIYSFLVGFIAGQIQIRFQEGAVVQRIPMLPEIQIFLARVGYFFKILRGTSVLCEVQISRK